MNIGEASAPNVLLVAALIRVPDHGDRERVAAAGELLADRAYRALGAGLDGQRWRAQFDAVQLDGECARCGQPQTSAIHLVDCAAQPREVAGVDR